MLTNNTIAELNALNDYATKHHGPFVDLVHGHGALRSEFLEVEHALMHRDLPALRRELMDVANVATRWAETLEGK